MTRRELLAGLPLTLQRSAAQATRPNFVFIMADDLGYADLSCYGRRDYQTPHIDSLAKGGMRFRQAYSNSPVCSATRCALMTGRYQYRLPVGLEEPIPRSSTRNPGLSPEHPTLPSLLKQAGYRTALLGKWHLGSLPDYGPLKSGYETFWGFRTGMLDYFTHKAGGAHTDTHDLWDGDRRVEEKGYFTTLLGNRAVKQIETSAKSRDPFLLSLHFNAPHWPWEGPGDEAESRRLRSLDHYDGGSMKTYAEMVTEMDRQVGRVLEALRRTGLAGNTVVVFTSDNGGERFSDTWPFTGKKSELLEGGLRVPAIVRWPGRIPAGRVTDQVAISMDWMPTFLEMAGVKPAPSYPPDGVSLLPALAGGTRSPRKLYWRYRYRAQRAVRDGDWKWLEIDGNRFLFDVAKDPLERANLKDRHPEVFEKMSTDWARWNATMLPEDPGAFSHTFYSDELPDHFGTKRKP